MYHNFAPAPYGAAVDTVENLARLERVLSNPRIGWHILCMLIAYIGILPIGLLHRRYHILCQLLMAIIASIGYYFGFYHHISISKPTSHPKGVPTIAPFTESTNTTSNSTLSPHFLLGVFMGILLWLQIFIGGLHKLLKYYWTDQPNKHQFPSDFHAWLDKSVRRLSRKLAKIHQWIGWSHLVLVFIQILLGLIRLGNMCQQHESILQCWEYYTTGTLLWWYVMICLFYSILQTESILFGLSRHELETRCLFIFGLITFIYNQRITRDHTILLLSIIWILCSGFGWIADTWQQMKSIRLWTLNQFPMIGLLLTSIILIVNTITRTNQSITFLKDMIGPMLLIATIMRLTSVWLQHYRKKYMRIREDTHQIKISILSYWKIFNNISLPSTPILLDIGSSLILLLTSIFIFASIDDWQRIMLARGVPLLAQICIMMTLSLLLFAYMMTLCSMLIEHHSPHQETTTLSQSRSSATLLALSTEFSRLQANHDQTETIPMQHFNTTV